MILLAASTLGTTGCEGVIRRLADRGDAGAAAGGSIGRTADDDAGTEPAATAATAAPAGSTKTPATVASAGPAPARSPVAAAPTARSAADIVKAFDACDVSGNGLLSGTEIACAGAGADANGDGRVTREEFAAAANRAPLPAQPVQPPPPAPPAPPPAPVANVAGIALGHYLCLTFDGGRLKPTPGDFVVVSGSTYRQTREQTIAQYALDPATNKVTWKSGAFATTAFPSTQWNPGNKHLFMKAGTSATWDCWAQ